MHASPVLNKVESLIAPSVESMGYRLVRILMMDGGKNRTLQVMVERADECTMTVDDCASISDRVSALLDVEDAVTGEYRLEVSSPGIDRPLVRAEDYTKYVGYEIKVDTSLPIEARKHFRGKLIAHEAENITVLVDGNRYDIPLHYIHAAKLVLTDELVREHLKASKKSKPKK